MSSWTKRHSLRHWDRIKDRLPKRGQRIVVLPAGSRRYDGTRASRPHRVKIAWAISA